MAHDHRPKAFNSHLSITSVLKDYEQHLLSSLFQTHGTANTEVPPDGQTGPSNERTCAIVPPYIYNEIMDF